MKMRTHVKYLAELIKRQYGFHSLLLFKNFPRSCYLILHSVQTLSKKLKEKSVIILLQKMVEHIKMKLKLGPYPQTIRIGATTELPAVFPCFPNYPTTCSYPGVDLEFIYTMIVRTLGLNVEWNFYENFTDLDKALNNNEIDLIGNTIIAGLKPKSDEVWLSTAANLYRGIGFIARTSSIAETLQPFKSFTWDLWVFIIIVTVIVGLLERSVTKSQHGFGFGISQHIYLFWFLFLSIIMNFYGNILTADTLINAKGTKAFSDLNDLGEKLIRKELQLVMFEKYMDVEAFQVLFNSDKNESWASNFRISLKTNPPILAPDKYATRDYVRKNFSLVGLDFVVADASLYSTLCDVEVKTFPDYLPFRPYVYYHTLKSLQLVFQELLAYDSFLHYGNVLINQYKFMMYNSDCKHSIQLADYILTLPTLRQIFIFLLSGLIASCLIKLGEKLKEYFVRNLVGENER